MLDDETVLLPTKVLCIVKQDEKITFEIGRSGVFSTNKLSRHDCADDELLDSFILALKF